MKNTSVLKAISKLYGAEVSADILDDIRCNLLAEHTARSGRDVLWFMDENVSEAIYIDTLEFLTEEEIEKELC